MPIDPAARAVTAYKLILDKAARADDGVLGIIFTKPRVVNGDGTVTPEAQLARQVVRINFDNRSSILGGDAGLNPKRVVVIYGVVGHPSVSDTDMQEGYTFIYGGKSYRIQDIIEVPGAIQALATTT